MKRLRYYLDPVMRLGERQYSVLFPFLYSLCLAILSEFYAYSIVHNPLVVGMYIIFLHAGTILYFSFRDGIRGGIIAAIIAILYYFYIIYTRKYSGSQLSSGLETTFGLGFIYVLLAYTIGWLKEKIDTLIRKESDEKHRLQAIIHQLPVGVIITDRTGLIVETNNELEKILGKKVKRGLVAGKDVILTAFTKGKQVDTSHSPIAQTLATEKDIVDQEFIIANGTKKKAHVMVNASAIRNSEGVVIAAASIIKDVTLQRETEERKDDFINMASHELKTPVTSMKLYIDMLGRLTKDVSNEKLQHVVESLHDQTKRLQDLVNNLLDVSRVHTGKFTLEKEVVQIDEIVKTVCDEIQNETKRVTITLDKIVKAQALADKLRMYQVLVNLLTNAIKYSPDQSSVHVSVTIQKEYIYVSVKDSGMGIEKDQQKKIFERLYQVTDAKEKTFPGLGMGLYISREIIKRHKGNIWVESVKGKGSTFFFSLPLYRKSKK
jgi:PAS domain S-box-containing protein